MTRNLSTTPETFDSIATYYADSALDLKWDLIFTLPAWLRVWWQAFGSGADLYLRGVRQGGEHHRGIAPLQIRNGVASIIGSVDVCDYQDFMVVPGKEQEFFTVVLDDLASQGIKHLELEPLRPESAVLTHLLPIARERKYSVNCEKKAASLEVGLPPTYDEYLGMLDGKQRHEIRRKGRNLGEAGTVGYQVLEDRMAIREALDTFLKLFIEARADKATFLTAPMESYFRSLVDSMSEAGLARIGVLTLENKVAAMVLYFDYNENIYLYNNGYDPGLSSLSVGTISKVMCIRNSIEKVRRFSTL